MVSKQQEMACQARRRLQTEGGEARIETLRSPGEENERRKRESSGTCAGIDGENTGETESRKNIPRKDRRGRGTISVNVSVKVFKKLVTTFSKHHMF